MQKVTLLLAWLAHACSGRKPLQVDSQKPLASILLCDGTTGFQLARGVPSVCTHRREFDKQTRYDQGGILAEEGSSDKAATIGAAALFAALDVFFFQADLPSAAVAGLLAAYVSTLSNGLGGAVKAAGGAAAEAYGKAGEINEQYEILPKAKTAADTITTVAGNLNSNYGLTDKIDEKLRLSPKIDELSDKIGSLRETVTSKATELADSARSPSSRSRGGDVKMQATTDSEEQEMSVEERKRRMNTLGEFLQDMTEEEKRKRGIWGGNSKKAPIIGTDQMRELQKEFGISSKEERWDPTKSIDDFDPGDVEPENKLLSFLVVFLFSFAGYLECELFQLPYWIYFFTIFGGIYWWSGVEDQRYRKFIVKAQELYDLQRNEMLRQKELDQGRKKRAPMVRGAGDVKMSMPEEDGSDRAAMIGAAALAAAFDIGVLNQGLPSAGLAALLGAYASTLGNGLGDATRQAGKFAADVFDSASKFNQEYEVLPKAKRAADTVTTVASNVNQNYGITDKIDEKLKLSNAASQVTDKLDDLKGKVDSKVTELKDAATKK